MSRSKKDLEKESMLKMLEFALLLPRTNCFFYSNGMCFAYATDAIKPKKKYYPSEKETKFKHKHSMNS